MDKIFTFGLKQTYKGENRLEELRKFILDNNINVVIDVRWNSGNYYTKWNCNGTHIEDMVGSLPRECIYHHLKFLGIPKKWRDRHIDSPETMKSEYVSNLKQIKAESWFSHYGEGVKVVLLCVENLEDPKTPHCHRIWLKEYLIEYFSTTCPNCGNKLEYNVDEELSFCNICKQWFEAGEKLDGDE